MQNRKNILQLIVDTNQYAGNFERQMCAYMTGVLGQCGVGKKEMLIAQQELTDDQLSMFEGLLAHVTDERGCKRPAEIAPNPRWINDGMGNHYRIDSDAFTRYRCPAYMSVGVWLKVMPDQEMLKLMMNRASLYADKHGIQIEGFRIGTERRGFQEILA